MPRAIADHDEAVGRLLARREIEDVLVRYCRAIDRQDVDLLRAVYHDDAVDERSSALPAQQWAIDFVRERRAKGTRSTHMLTNVSIVFAGRGVRSESYVLAVQHEPASSADAPTDLLAYGGRYLDVWEQRPHWAITHRRVVHDWSCLSTLRQLPWLQSFAQGAPVPDDVAYAHLSPG